MIRVLLCDDHAVVRAGLGQLLHTWDDLDVVGEAGSPEEAVVVYRDVRPDVVLMDLAMPVTDGIAGTRMLRELDPAARIVVLTAFLDRAKVLAALGAGAVGYLLKDSTPEEIVAGVRAAHRGELPIDPKATKMVLSPADVAAGMAADLPADLPAELPVAAVVEADRPTFDLSRRELEALELVAQGHANKIIARRLNIAEKTVKAHLTNVFRRLGLENRTQAAQWYHDHLGDPR